VRRSGEAASSKLLPSCPERSSEDVEDAAAPPNRPPDLLDCTSSNASSWRDEVDDTGQELHVASSWTRATLSGFGAPPYNHLKERSQMASDFAYKNLRSLYNRSHATAAY